MITEKFIGYPERPRKVVKISEMRRKLEENKGHLIGETNPSKRAIFESENENLARMIVMRANKLKIKKSYYGRF